MPLEILERAKPGGKYHAPTFRVRCALCGAVYLVAMKGAFIAGYRARAAEQVTRSGSKGDW